jgi:hypothetical protein
MSLLSDAKEFKKNRSSKDISEEERELAIAWARGEITLYQASKAFSKTRGIKHGTGVYVLLARSLRDIIIKNNKKI